MKNVRSICSVICGVFILGTATLHAADAKSYQVTGPVLAVTPTVVTVQKGDEKWEIARSKATKVTGDLKVGAKVTVYYKMVADEVEVKEARAKK